MEWNWGPSTTTTTRELAAQAHLNDVLSFYAHLCSSKQCSANASAAQSPSARPSRREEKNETNHTCQQRINLFKRCCLVLFFRCFVLVTFFFLFFFFRRDVREGGRAVTWEQEGVHRKKKTWEHRKKKKKKNYENRLTWLSCEGEHHFSLASSWRPLLQKVSRCKVYYCEEKKKKKRENKTLYEYGCGENWPHHEKESFALWRWGWISFCRNVIC